ncbi:hypothetical protein SK128_023313 [Halocaridina rubra]|uniref:Uncharacterized protein n=1 Tax=Halocaridina rubra TaxID=373956 RepID=A0AAN8X7K9_HALRR
MTSNTLPTSRPVSAGGNVSQQRWGSEEEPQRTGVTVTLPTIQVTEHRQTNQDIPTLELPTLQLDDPAEGTDTHLLGLELSSGSSSQSNFSTSASFPLIKQPPIVPSGPIQEVKLPPLVVPPDAPPANLSDAIELVRRNNMILYLTLQHSPSELEYNPYSFNVVTTRPKGFRQYAILSSAGVTQVWPTEVTFTTIEAFQREVTIYKKLQRIKFFRVFRLRKTWQVWRKSVRSRKVKESQTRISAYLVIHQPPFHATLVHVAALCDKLSHMGLLQLECEDPVMMDNWMSQQQAAMTSVRSKLIAFRSLLLQVVASMVHADETSAETEGSELLSGDKKSPRSNTGSSTMTRRHTSTSILKMVRVVDLMVASTLRTVLLNTVNSLLKVLTASNDSTTAQENNQTEEGARDDIDAMFLIVVGVENGGIVCTPTQDGLVNGLRVVLRACEVTILCVLPILPYFAPHDRQECKYWILVLNIFTKFEFMGMLSSELVTSGDDPPHLTQFLRNELSTGVPEENLLLRTMLEEDTRLKDTTNQILTVVDEYWNKVEECVSPLESLLKEAQTKTRDKEEESTKQELGALGTWLARIEGLVKSVGEVQEIVPLGLLRVDQTAAKKVVVTSLRQQQQRMHQDVSQGFDQRVRALQADATDKWLGLEQAPVTAEQVVNLLNYVLEVRNQVRND